MFSCEELPVVDFGIVMNALAGRGLVRMLAYRPEYRLEKGGG